MARLSPEKREEMFRAMRDRQQKLREIREAKAPAPEEPEERAPKQAAGELPDWGELEMFRVREVAQKLKVSEDTVVRWFRDLAVVVDGPGHETGRRRKQTILIPRSALEAWVREHYQGRHRHH